MRMSFVRRRATTLLLVATLLSPLRSNAFIATTPRSVSTATAHGRCAHDKQPPNSPTSARKPSTRGTTRRPVSCDTGGGGSTSRKHFLQKGAVAAAWGLVAASLAPPPSLAKDVGGIDIRGIDVSEVLHMGAGESGGKATKPLRDCVLNVERVRISTQQLEDALTNEGAPPGLNGLVRGLIKNYKLDESLRQGAMYIESQGDRNTAASAGREALEYLAQTAEYFPVEIDDRTGAPKKMNSEALEFTVNALSATRVKLDLFLSKVPTDALREARAEIKSEGEEEG